jgi:hypothetical protein
VWLITQSSSRRKILFSMSISGKILTNAQRLRWLEISALTAKINGKN